MAVVVCDGDSLTLGSSAPGSEYPTQLDALLGAGWTTVNQGTGSETVPMMQVDGGEVDASYTLGSENICVLWGGINDIALGHTAADIMASLREYCNARRARGWRVVICTITPCDTNSIASGREATRQTLNGYIRSDWTTFADGLADIGGTTHLSDYGDQTDGDYFDGDHVHLTAAGYALVAGVVKTAIDGLPAGVPVMSRSSGGASRTSVRDKLSLLVGATAPEIELLHDPALEISGLRWRSQMPGGDIDLMFSIACPNPLLRLRNALQEGSRVWLRFGSLNVWQGKILPLETEIGETDGSVNVSCVGTYTEAAQNETLTYTAVDTDMGNWCLDPASNQQICSDNQGQLLLYLNKGSACMASGGTATWYYWLDNGMTTRIIDHVVVDYAHDLTDANWFAFLSVVPSPWGGPAGVLKTWTDTSGSASAQSYACGVAGYRALVFQMQTSSDIAASAATRYIKLTNVAVYTVVAIPTIDSLMWDLLNGAGVAASREYEVLDTLPQAAWRDPQSYISICADAAKQTSVLVDWGLFGSLLYVKARPAATSRTTLALRRSDFADGGSDSIVGGRENAVAGVMVIYATDGTGTDAGYPHGTIRTTSFGSLSLVSNRAPALSYTDTPMSPTKAYAIAQREYTLKNADAWTGSIPVGLSRPLQNDVGAPVDPLSLSVRDWYLRRTYDLTPTPIKITQIDGDLDADTLTLSVGSAEERQLWLPGSKPKAGARRVKKFGPWRTVKGRRTRKSWWEFQ